MFTSAATGLAVGIAFIRGLTGRPLGNFTLISARYTNATSIGAIVLIVLGVPQTLAGPATVTTLEGYYAVIARGPVAAFEIIKQLGENGGGFLLLTPYPFENPNGGTPIDRSWQCSAFPLH